MDRLSERRNGARSFLGAIVLTLAIGSAAPSLARAAFPGLDGPIAFTSNRDSGAADIFTIVPGRTAARLRNGNSSSDPVYSPDGRKIAFVNANGQLAVMNADGSGRTAITATATTKQDPTWSPDGRIAYVANSFDVDGQTDLEIWVVNADGSGRVQLTQNTFLDGEPAWSPDGASIAFVASRPGDTDRNVYLMNADGSGEVNLTPNEQLPCDGLCYQGHDDNPAWFPDGSRIAYAHTFDENGGGLPNIWTMGRDGSNKDNLTDNNTVSFTQPAPSPQGTRIAAVGAVTTDRDIWLMNADGTGQAPIETILSHDISPDWGVAAAAPVQGKTVNASVVSGTVLVDVPGGGQGFIPLEEATQLPVGTKVDTRDGRVAITSATSQGGTQSADFFDARFQIRQKANKDLTTMKILERPQCAGSRDGRNQLGKRKRKPGLWGSGNGNFATQGNHGSASVRGTEWLLFEACGGITGVTVKEGSVKFRNFYTRRTVLVNAGDTALAKPVKKSR